MKKSFKGRVDRLNTKPQLKSALQIVEDWQFENYCEGIGVKVLKDYYNELLPSLVLSNGSICSEWEHTKSEYIDFIRRVIKQNMAFVVKLNCTKLQRGFTPENLAFCVQACIRDRVDSAMNNTPRWLYDPLFFNQDELGEIE